MPHIAWELKLLTSGDLNIKKILTKYTDVFLVGGGGGGGGAVAPQGVSGGGGGGTRGSNGSAGTGQGSTTRAFAESFNVLYATGGTGGAGYVYVGSTHTKGYQGGVDGADGTTVEADIVVAKANTGNGGPGGGYSSISGGNGGSGIVILRGRYE